MSQIQYETLHPQFGASLRGIDVAVNVMSPMLMPVRHRPRRWLPACVVPAPTILLGDRRIVGVLRRTSNGLPLLTVDTVKH